jgi:hypothetical protein
MILAGIDEAGLGPTLGPLATASAALETPDGWEPGSPWDRLDAVVCGEWKKGDTRLAVADSKILYTSGGLAAFESTLGVFSLLANGSMTPRIVIVDADAAPAHPCYRADRAKDGAAITEPFPAHCRAEAVLEAADRARTVFAASGVVAAHLEAALLYEPRLNSRYDAGLNKNAALLMETGRHLAFLVERFADRGLSVVVDKQGGRNAYLPFLTNLFPGAWVEELEAGNEISRYRVRHEKGVVGISFRARGDRTSFATALASLAAKYARERAMAAMNAWFCEKFPDLRETAGYPQDARRWLADVEKLGGDESVALLIRRR